MMIRPTLTPSQIRLFAYLGQSEKAQLGPQAPPHRHPAEQQHSRAVQFGNLSSAATRNASAVPPQRTASYSEIYLAGEYSSESEGESDLELDDRVDGAIARRTLPSYPLPPHPLPPKRAQTSLPQRPLERPKSPLLEVCEKQPRDAVERGSL